MLLSLVLARPKLSFQVGEATIFQLVSVIPFLHMCPPKESSTAFYQFLYRFSSGQKTLRDNRLVGLEGLLERG